MEFCLWETLERYYERTWVMQARLVVCRPRIAKGRDGPPTSQIMIVRATRVGCYLPYTEGRKSP